MITTKNRKFHSFFITCGLLLFSSLLSIVFFYIDSNSNTSANIELIYILTLVLIARYTDGYFYGVFASVVVVILINFFYTFPYFELNFTLSGYPITFLGMLSITVITSATASSIKEQARIIAEREKMLTEAEKEKMRTTLLRAVSHDLRTPLTSIIGSSSSYLENYDSLTEEERSSLISNIREDSQWLLNMVENLLSVTRINNQAATVTTSMELVEEVVSEAVLRLKKRIPDILVKVSVPDTYLMIPMDATLIEQVIINLLENSAVHSLSDKEILFFVEDSGCEVTFHIRDYGVGINPQKLATIFNGADSISSQSDGHKGIGIGLSICKTIITAHRGEIRAVNHPDGIEFIFTLPKEETA